MNGGLLVFVIFLGSFHSIHAAVPSIGVTISPSTVIPATTQQITLSATASSNNGPNCAITSYQWLVLSTPTSPQNNTSTIFKSPTSPNTDVIGLTIPGLWLLQLSVIDSCGNTMSTLTFSVRRLGGTSPAVVTPTTVAPTGTGGNVATPTTTLPPTSPLPNMNDTLIAAGQGNIIKSTGNKLNPVVIIVPIVLVLLGIGVTAMSVLFVRKRAKRQQVKQASRERMFSSFEPTRATRMGSQESSMNPSPLTTVTITPVHVPYDPNADWQGSIRPTSITRTSSPTGSPIPTRASPPGSPIPTLASPPGSPIPTRASHSGSPLPTRSSTPPPPSDDMMDGPGANPPEWDQGSMGMMDDDMYSADATPRWQPQTEPIPEGEEPQATPVPSAPRLIMKSPKSRNKPLPQIPQ